MIGAAQWDGKQSPDDLVIVSASTVGKVLNIHSLRQWERWAAARWAVANLDLLSEVRASNERTAQSMVVDSPYQPPPGELSPSDRGTLLHEVFEAWTLGKPTPERLSDWPDLWPLATLLGQWIGAHELHVVAAEAVVYNPDSGLGGRTDLVVRLAGELWGLDLKTKDRDAYSNGQKVKPYAETHPMQLAAYRFATHRMTWEPRVIGGGAGRIYLVNPEEHAAAEPWQQPARSGVLMLTPERCQLYALDSDVEQVAYQRATDAARLWRWMHDECSRAFVPTDLAVGAV